MQGEGEKQQQEEEEEEEEDLVAETVATTSQNSCHIGGELERSRRFDIHRHDLGKHPTEINVHDAGAKNQTRRPASLQSRAAIKNFKPSNPNEIPTAHLPSLFIKMFPS